MAKRKAKEASLIVLALVFLFNPNIQVVDLLPDFVAYFILAHLLEKPALMAPYFDEARSASLKLALISLMKIPAFMLAVLIRSKNTLDNDVFPMLALIFATLEIIYGISFIKNISSAFFHLGERGSAAALITPFSLTKSGKREMRPEDLRGFTVFFLVAKCLLYTVPEFLLLSRTADNGTITPAPLSRFYPWTLIISLALGFIIGGIWLHRSKRYLKATLSEGEFTNSLNFLKNEGSDEEYLTRVKLRTTKRALILIAVATVFSFPMAFKETELINLFPSFIFSAFFIFALLKLKPHTQTSFKPSLISGAVFSALSVIAFGFSVSFLTKYDYLELGNKLSSSHDKVMSSYIFVVITAALELLALIAFFVFAFRYLDSYIKENTGLSPKSERYSRTEREYHSELKKRLYIFFGIGLLTYVLKFIEICLYLAPKTSFSNMDGVASPVTGSALPWFGVLITVSSALFIGYAIYFTRLLAEEVELKYKNS